MRNKVNYIIGGVMALLFSVSAATGIMTGWPFGMRWLPSPTAAMLGDWFRRIHLIVGLLLIAFVIFHIWRNWAWIMAMTEIIRQERELAGEPLEDPALDEGAPVDGGAGSGEVPIDVIDEDDFLDDDDDGEPADPAADEDEGDTPKK